MSRASGCIDFAIVGAQKSSSTFLHHALRLSPEVWMPPGETPLFHGHHYAPQKVDALVESASEDAAVMGVKRPNYLYLCEEARRLWSHNGQMKILIVLRERISRTISAYHHLMCVGRLPVRDVEQGLDILLEAAEPWQSLQGHTALTYSLYTDGIDAYRRLFGIENVCVILQKDLIAAPQETADKVFDFLGVASADVSQAVKKRYQSVYYDLEAISLLADAARRQSIVNEAGVVLQTRRDVSEQASREIQDLRRRAAAVGYGEKPKLSVSMTQKLEAYFADDAAATSEMGFAV